MRSLINHLLLQGVQELIKYQWFTANFVSVFTREERDKLTILHSELCKSEQQSALGQRFFQDCAHYAFPIIIKQARTHASIVGMQSTWNSAHIKNFTFQNGCVNKTKSTIDGKGSVSQLWGDFLHFCALMIVLLPNWLLAISYYYLSQPYNVSPTFTIW